MRSLDDDSAEGAMHDPELFRSTFSPVLFTADGALRLDLQPHAIVRLETSEEPRN